MQVPEIKIGLGRRGVTGSQESGVGSQESGVGRQGTGDRGWRRSAECGGHPGETPSGTPLGSPEKLAKLALVCVSQGKCFTPKE